MEEGYLPTFEWLCRTRPLRGDIDLFHADSVKDLFSDEPEGPIIVEGCRSAGKSTMARHLSTRYNVPIYKTWDSIRHLKRIAESDVVHLEDCGQDLAQSMLFVFDFWLQAPNRQKFFVSDRGMFSNMIFSGKVHLGRWTQYVKMLQKMKATVVVLSAVPYLSYGFSERLKSRGVPLSDARIEESTFLSIALRLPTAVRVIYCRLKGA